MEGEMINEMCKFLQSETAKTGAETNKSKWIQKTVTSAARAGPIPVSSAKE